MRYAVLVLIVVKRHHFGFQDVIQRLEVALVLFGGRHVAHAVADGEPVEPVVGLGPPAVEDGQVEAAVEQHLLPAGSARLLRPARGIEPHVHTLHQMASHVDVVVLDENHTRTQVVQQTGLIDRTQKLLARLVVGMRLAGKN